MKRTTFASAVSPLLFGAAALTPTLTHAADFTLSSPEIKAGSSIPKSFEFNGFGCNGDNKSPVLKWSGAPKAAKSFAVTMYDPDAPSGSGWWHWMVINIPAAVTELPADAGALNSVLLPKGAMQGHSDFGSNAWGGVCPPQGDKPHRYIFTVYALKTEKLELPADATAALTGYMINGNALDKASFTAKYGRSR